MYSPVRDYRVFDLYSHEPVSLANHRQLTPGGIYGLRIEILEETSGPSWEGPHRRYVLHLPKAYIVKYHTGIATRTSKLKMPKPTGGADFGFIHQWGDLLPQPESHSGGAPLPQGLQYPSWHLSRGVRLASWISRQGNRMLYGGPYPRPGQRHRLSQIGERAKRRHSGTMAVNLPNRQSDEDERHETDHDGNGDFNVENGNKRDS